jgi:hypothetical protein
MTQKRFVIGRCFFHVKRKYLLPSGDHQLSGGAGQSKRFLWPTLFFGRISLFDHP